MEILSERVLVLEGLFDKMKLILSGVLKITSKNIPPLLMNVIKDIFSDAEANSFNLKETSKVENQSLESIATNRSGFQTRSESSQSQTPKNSREIGIHQGYNPMRKMSNQVIQQTLHFGIIYSNPLISIKKQSRSKNKNNKPACYSKDPVDFATECTKILDVLISHQKKLNVHIQCAQIDQLVKLVLKRPKVLHIICHGDYDSEAKEYYLEFENNRSELYKLSTSRMRAILRNHDLSFIKLVFVNACHSEEVAKEFLKRGVDCVIVIRDKHKINDEYARVFSNFLYEGLIQQETINQAFKNAITYLQAYFIDYDESCCCGHSHDVNCEWMKAAKSDLGFENAHFKHVSYCDCPRADKRIHKNDCQWAINFLLKYNENYYFENCKKKEFKVCCCQNDLPHDETMKLKIFYRDDNSSLGDIVLFPSIEPGTVNQLNPCFFAGTTFKDCTPIGQNLLLYKMYNSLVNEGVRVVYLTGSSGSGKSNLAKQLSNYMEERWKIEQVKYLNLDYSKSISSLSSKLQGMVYSQDRRNPSSKGSLIILDHTNVLIKHHAPELRKELLDKVQNSELIFIVLTYKRKELLVNTVLSKYEKVFTVPGMSKRAAAKMLINLSLKDLPYAYRNVTTLEEHQIFSSDASKRFLAKDIERISLKLRNDTSLDQIAQDLANEEQDESEEGYLNEESIKLSIDSKISFLDNLQFFNRDYYSFYIFTGLFAGGLLIADLEKASFNSLIPKNCSLMIRNLYRASNIEDLKKSLSEIDDKDLIQKENNSTILKNLAEKQNNLSNKNSICFMLKKVLINQKTEIYMTVPSFTKESIEIQINDPLIKLEYAFKFISHLNSIYFEIISLNKQIPFYLEDLCECSRINSSEFWSRSPLSPQKNRNTIFKFIGESMNQAEVENLIVHHEPNIKCFLTGSDSLSLSACLETIGANYHSEDIKVQKLSTAFLESLQDIIINLLTVSKMRKNYDECIEYTYYIENLLMKDVSKVLEKELFTNLKVRINIYLQNIFYVKLKANPACRIELDEILGQFNLIETRLGLLDRENYLHFEGEYLIIKYCTLEILSNRKVENLPLLVRETVKEIKGLIKSIDELPEALYPNYYHLVCKLRFVVCEFNYHSNELSKSDYSFIKQSQSQFQLQESHRLVMKCNYMLSLLLENKPEECMKYAREGLELASKFQERKYKRRFEDLVILASSKVRMTNLNRFLIYSSYPLQRHSQYPDEFFNTPRCLREMLIGPLKKTNRNILVHFEELNSSNVISSLITQQSGEMLVLDFAESKSGNLIFENENKLIPPATIEEIMANNINSKSSVQFQVIFVLNGNISQLKDILGRQVSPYALVYFDFSQFKKITNRDLLIPFSINFFKYKFMISFIKKYVSGFGIDDAVQDAKMDSIEELLHELTCNYSYMEAEASLDEVLKECQIKDIPHFEILFRDSVIIEGGNRVKKRQLPIGFLKETSPLFIRKLKGIQTPHLKRPFEVLSMMSKLKKNNWINLYGDSGSGKSYFSQLLKQELSLRGLYKDGIYIFNLDHSNTNINNIQEHTKDIKVEMSRQLGEMFEHKMISYLEQNEILVIFDDFDCVVHEKQYRYPTFVLKALKESNTHCIFITKRRIKEERQLINFEVMTLQKISPNNRLTLALNYLNKTFLKFESEDERLILQNRLVSYANSDLRVLKNQNEEIIDLKSNKRNNNTGVNRAKNIFQSLMTPQNTNKNRIIEESEFENDPEERFSIPFPVFGDNDIIDSPLKRRKNKTDQEWKKLLGNKFI